MGSHRAARINLGRGERRQTVSQHNPSDGQDTDEDTHLDAGTGASSRQLSNKPLERMSTTTENFIGRARSDL